MSVAIEPCPLLVVENLLPRLDLLPAGPPPQPPTHPNYNRTHEDSVIHLGITSRHKNVSIVALHCF